MAKELVARTICDRCGKAAEEVVDGAGVSGDVATPPRFYIEVKGRKVVQLEDLCSKCEDRVNSLIEDIKLEKPAKEKKPAKKSKEKDSTGDRKVIKEKTDG